MERNAWYRQSFELKRIGLTSRRLGRVEFWIAKNITIAYMSSNCVGESDSNFKNVIPIELEAVWNR